MAQEGAILQLFHENWEFLNARELPEFKVCFKIYAAFSPQVMVMIGSEYIKFTVRGQNSVLLVSVSVFVFIPTIGINVLVDVIFKILLELFLRSKISNQKISRLNLRIIFKLFALLVKSG